MERFGLFLDKFGFHASMVGVYSRMVVVGIVTWDFLCWSGEVTDERYSFSANPKGSVEIRDGIVMCKGVSSSSDHGGKMVRPVTMTIGILAAHPADKIPVDKVEAEESTSIGAGLSPTELEGQADIGWRPRLTKNRH